MRCTLPTRENVLPLLSDIVRKQDSGKLLSDTAPPPRGHCGSRVLPQKRILEQEFAIRYPTTNKRSRELFPRGSPSTVGNTQEDDYFKLAFELQYAENMTCTQSESNLDFLSYAPADSILDNSSEPEDDMDAETNNAATALLSLNNNSNH